jgi:serine/threonine protein kinase
VLREQIARGGMGEVFRAVAIGAGGFEKPVVVKRVLPGLGGTDAVAMFVEEAKLMSRLAHPNIVQVIDFGKGDRDDYFLVMELVDGVDLAALLAAYRARDEAVPLPLAIHVITQLLRGLGHAHAESRDGRSLVHRDVSPSNVLLSRVGEVKVADFGVALVARAGDDGGAIVGKPSYMAPEQWRGEALGPTADLFAAGVVLFQMLTAEMPFEGATAEERHERAARGETKSAVSSRPEIGDGLDAVLRQALAPDPNGRFGGARAMRRAIEAASPAPIGSSDDLADAVERVMASRPRPKPVVALGLGVRDPSESHLGELTRADPEGPFTVRATEAPTVPVEDEQSRMQPRAPRRRLWPWALVPLVAGAGWWGWRSLPRTPAEPPLPVASATATAPEPVGTIAPAPPPSPVVVAPSASTPVPRPAPRVAATSAPASPPPPCTGVVLLAAKGSWWVSGGPARVQAPGRYDWPCGSYTLSGESRQDGRSVSRSVVVRDGAQSATRFE